MSGGSCISNPIARRWWQHIFWAVASAINLPLYKRKTRIGGLKRLREVETPLFSGYICFALDRDKHNLLYDTKKFVRIIEVDDQQRFVQELDQIVKAIDSGQDLLVRPGWLQASGCSYSPGRWKAPKGLLSEAAWSANWPYLFGCSIRA